MNNIMLIYPPGKIYQRSEDRAQSNIENSVANCIHACNDLGYAASVLIKSGYNVFLRDYQTERAGFDDVINDLISFKPDMMVISTTNATICDDIDFINKANEIHKCISVMKGSIFFTKELKIFEKFDFSNISYLIGGELDFIISPLADYVFKNKGALEKINGIIYKENNILKSTRFDIWQDDLDSQPFPARHLMNNKLYLRPDIGEPMATIQISRGCPYNCAFCLTPIISGCNVRIRSVENVLAELKECYEIFGIKHFFLKADTFTINKKWVYDFCYAVIDSPLFGKIEFTVNSRTNNVTKEMLSLLKKAGCFAIAFGFESASDYTLEKIRKGTTSEDNIRAMQIAKEAKITVFGFFVIGFPWETEKDIIQTLSFMLELDSDFIEVHIAMPYYGTDLYSMCIEYSTIKNDAWGFDYFSPNTIGTSTVSMEKILKLKKKYLLKFHLRPSYLLKRFCDCIKHPIIFKNYFIYGLRLIKNIF